MFLDILLTVALPTLLAVAAVVVGGRRGRVASGDSDADSLSFAGGVISALFTVVLAFYIVFAWQAGADVEGSAGTEADALLSAYWQADALPAPQRAELQGLAREYATAVADREWALLARGGTEPRVPQIVRELRAGFAALPADGGATGSAREQGLRDVRQLDESHRARVALSSGSDPLTLVLLGGTVLGAALMIGFPLLVGVSATPVNIAVVTLLALTIGATVHLSVQLAHPLQGPFGIEPSAFLDAIAEMRPSLPT